MRTAEIPAGPDAALTVVVLGLRRFANRGVEKNIAAFAETEAAGADIIRRRALHSDALHAPLHNAHGYKSHNKPDAYGDGYPDKTRPGACLGWGKIVKILVGIVIAPLLVALVLHVLGQIGAAVPDEGIKGRITVPVREEGGDILTDGVEIVVGKSVDGVALGGYMPFPLDRKSVV